MVTDPVFLVHLDNWAQDPALHPRAEGYPTIQHAVRAAEGALRAPNNVTDVARIFLRPSEPGWLVPGGELASVRQRPPPSRFFLGHFELRLYPTPRS